MFDWLRNLVSRRPTTGSGIARARRVVRAKFDSAQFTPENAKHWAQSDFLSANAAARREVRWTLRNRARYPITQAQAAARELAGIIRETSGADVFVRPVVLYPGWFTRQPKSAAVWVLNENAFPKFLEHEDQKFSPDDVQRISAGIAMHVRNLEKNR
jgi:hypothetical protein